MLRTARLLAVVSVLLLLTLSSTPVLAGEGVGYRGWGLRGGVTVDPDQLHVGAHLDLGEFRPQLRFVPNIEVGFGDDETVIAVNAETYWIFRNVQLDLPEEAGVWRPYLGGGVGVNFINRDLEPKSRLDDSDTELGLNILAGLEKRLSGGNRFIAELKIGVIDAPDVKLAVGITF